MDRFREDIFKEGEVGGHCHLHKSELKAQGEHISALQSWYAELNAYTELNFKPLASKSKVCDVTIKRPTILMKLDAGSCVSYVTIPRIIIRGFIRIFVC
jgi:protein O-GlcNAc transferase